MKARKIDAMHERFGTCGVLQCRDCKYSDTFADTTEDTMPLKCLNIRYGGVCPDWYCEHGERRESE